MANFICETSRRTQSKCLTLRCVTDKNCLRKRRNWTLFKKKKRLDRELLCVLDGFFVGRGCGVCVSVAVMSKKIGRGRERDNKNNIFLLSRVSERE